MSSREVVAPAARTVTGQSAAITVPPLTAPKLAFLFDVAAIVSTPTLTLSVEWSHDAVTWFVGDPADEFTAVTTVGKKAKAFDVKGAFYRLVWTITGGASPSVTFAVVEYSF